MKIECECGQCYPDQAGVDLCTAHGHNFRGLTDSEKSAAGQSFADSLAALRKPDPELKLIDRIVDAGKAAREFVRQYREAHPVSNVEEMAIIWAVHCDGEYSDAFEELLEAGDKLLELEGGDHE